MHGLAVVGEPERAGVAQLGHLGQRLAGQPTRDRGQEADRHARLAPRWRAQRAQHRRGVDHRVGVRHRHHGDVAAGRGGAGAGVEVLLVLLPGRAQVHVRVDEAREQVPALAVDHLDAVGGQRAGRAELGDLAAAHEHVVRRVDPAARVEHVGAADQQVGGRRRPCVERAHAGTGAEIVSGALRGAAARQALVEHRHADDDAGGDLLADDRLRRVDHLGGELDAAVDRAGVHEHLARAEPAAVDLVAGGVLADRRDEASRSSARSASAARTRRRPRRAGRACTRPRSRASRSRAGSASAARTR